MQLSRRARLDTIPGVHFILKITCNNCILNISKYFFVDIYNSYCMINIKQIHDFYDLISIIYVFCFDIDGLNVFQMAIVHVCRM